MAFPKVLFALPLIAAGMYAPALGSDPAPASAGVLGMEHLFFAKDQVDVKCGQTLPMVNDSRWVHIIGPGQGGLITDAPAGVPVKSRELVETNGTYETGRWTVPGQYSLTCSVHPDMTVKVVVTDCCC